MEKTDVAALAAKKILILSNNEQGFINVLLATTNAILQASPDTQIHFAAFKHTHEAAITTEWEHAKAAQPTARKPIYHEIEGLTYTEGLTKHMDSNGIDHSDNFPTSWLGRRNASSTITAIKQSVPIIFPYDTDDLITIFDSIVKIIKDVDADLVIVDPMLSPAVIAVTHLNVKYLVLAPNTIKEFASAKEPNGAYFWKFPALFSGFRFPVPWYQIPLNAVYILYSIYTLVSSPILKGVSSEFRQRTGAEFKTVFHLIQKPTPNFKVLVGIYPELDFPVHVPSYLRPCGPIVRFAHPVSESDPELQTWLARGPTVYINLGSLFKFHEERAVEMARALRILIDAYNAKAKDGKQLQVLWKLKKSTEYPITEAGSKIHNILGKELDNDLVRIMSWVVAEPIAVLQSGHVICSIHHGGANSYCEAVVTGVPQIVLPQWTDTYDFANRVEWHGIGRIGNPTTKPNWTVGELSQAMTDVIVSDETEKIKAKAAEMATICETKGNGAERAAKAILEDLAE